MRISVIIPTLNSQKVIQRVLNSVFNGNYKPDEVIVVDGGSKDMTVTYAQDFPVNIYHNSKVHAAAARNIGIEQSSGKIIAFTDSDCVPQKDWLERIHHHLSTNKNLIGVGGRMFPLSSVNNIETFSGHVFLNEIMCYPSNPRNVDKLSLAGAFITANCAYRRDILLKIGGFRDIFGNNAEDIDLFWRLIKSGQSLYYDPNIIVFHSFPDTRWKLAKKYFQHGIASSKLTKYHLSNPRIDLMIYRKLVTNFIRLILPKHDRELASLYCIQLTAHLFGKIYGSVLVKCINL